MSTVRTDATVVISDNDNAISSKYIVIIIMQRDSVRENNVWGHLLSN